MTRGRQPVPRGRCSRVGLPLNGPHSPRKALWVKAKLGLLANGPFLYFHTLAQHDCGAQGLLVLGVSCLQETKHVWGGGTNVHYLGLISMA